MERRAFISINGATYEHAYRISGGESDAQLRQVQDQVDRLVVGDDATVHVLDVLIQGNRAQLKVTPRDVWAASAFLEADEPASPPPQVW